MPIDFTESAKTLVGAALGSRIPEEYFKFLGNLDAIEKILKEKDRVIGSLQNNLDDLSTTLNKYKSAYEKRKRELDHLKEVTPQVSSLKARIQELESQLKVKSEASAKFNLEDIYRSLRVAFSQYTNVFRSSNPKRLNISITDSAGRYGMVYEIIRSNSESWSEPTLRTERSA